MRKTHAFTFLGLIVCLIPCMSVDASIVVDAPIFEDTVWKESEGPYLITTSINVRPEATLTIEPGTSIIFNAGELVVEGKLRAEGTEENTITFVSDTTENKGGIIFIRTQATSSLIHTSFKNMSTGITSVSSTLSLRNMNIADSEEGIVSSNSHIEGEHIELSAIKNTALIIFNESIVSINDFSIKNSLRDAVNIYGASNVKLHNGIIEKSEGDALNVYGNSYLNLTQSTLTYGSQNGIQAYNNAHVSIARSTISHFVGNGLVGFKGGVIDISHSLISDNNSGFEFYSPQQVKISDSSIINNGSMEVYSNPGITIDARNNWWGSIDGPGEKVSLDVDVEPWLTNDPRAEAICCSNILFLPGLEASRLYKERALGGDDQLWEPNINSDVKDLYLDASGQSINKNIFTKDIIARTNLPILNIDIYRTFFESLDTLVNNKSINGWDAYPYDWRLDVEDIVKNGTNIKDGESNVLLTVERMAFQSKTKKVTLIAHSNGGLLVKALVQELEKKGKAYLIDKVILVATPQLGTPKALGVLLHGIDHSIGRGIILNESTARSLAQNMPGAYNLLPSSKYYSVQQSPLIFFDSSIDSISNLRQKYGNAISNSTTMDSFLTAELDNRTNPENKINVPTVANSNLLNKSQILHSYFDLWNFPSTIEVTKISGTNIDTLQSIRYYKKSSYTCVLLLCSTKEYLDYSPQFTKDGDGTVAIVSANHGSSTKHIIDLYTYNKQSGENRDHTDIMEVSSVKKLITSIVTNDKNSLVTENIHNSEQDILRVSMHSPAVIDIYDSEGRHTGPLSGNASSTIRLYEAKIPNSYYFPFGEGVYAAMTNNSGSKIKISGAGIGTFTLKVGEYSFEDIPVLPLTQGEITIEQNKAPVLDVDLNGDGTRDLIVDTQSSFDPIAYLSVMKTVILTLDIPKKTKDNLISKADKIIKKIQTDKMKQVEKIIKKYSKRVEFKNKHTKKIMNEDAAVLVTMFSELLDNI